jgi:hypothetical protein
LRFFFFGIVERRAVAVVELVDVGPVRYQQPDHVVPAGGRWDGEMQGRTAVSILCIEVDANWRSVRSVSSYLLSAFSDIAAR